MRKLRFLCVAVILFPVCTFAQNTIYSNSSSGNDATGDGSAGAPYKTFHKAYTMASSGDIIDLTGTYDWTDADESGDAVTSGYTIQKNLTIQGHGPAQTIIQAASSSGTADRGILTVPTGYTVTIDAMTLRYANKPDHGGAIHNTGTLTVSNCYITDNIVTGSYKYAAGIYNNNELTLENSCIANNHGTSRGSGVLSHYYADYIIVSNCTFFNNTGSYALNIDRTEDIYITNTVIYGNFSGFYTYGEDDMYIKNCIMAGNTNANFYQNYRYSSQHIHDNGYNIMEEPIHYNWSSGQSTTFPFTATGNWTDNTGSGTYTQQGTASTGTLNIASSLTPPGNGPNGVPHLVISSGSISIDNGDDAVDNSIVSIPCNDGRMLYTNGTKDIGAYEYNGAASCPTAFEWNGSSSFDWNNPANWSTGTVPTSSDNVLIPTGASMYPQLSSGGTMEVNALTIESNASLTVPAGVGLEINGDLTNDGRIILKSNVSGTASMLDNGIITGSGTVVMERYLAQGGYHHVGASHSNAPISELGDDMNLVLGSPYIGNDTTQTVVPFPTLFAYDETNPSPSMSLGWGDPGSHFIAGCGYAGNAGIWGSSLTLDIEGSSNTGTVNIPVTNTSSGIPAVDGWNLVCNPYPSALNWNSVSKVNVPNGYYCFSATGQYTGTYHSYVNGISNPGGALSNLIPPSQAFFVKAAANGSLSMNNSARELADPNFYKSSNEKTQAPILRLNGLLLNGGTIPDETVIYFDPNATVNFDSDFDALKIFNNDPLMPNIYTRTCNFEALSINAITTIDVNEVIIPLGFKVDQAGDYRIDGSQIQNFPPNIGIYLVDISLNKTIDLRTNPFYQFNSNPNDSADRFYLRFTPMIATGVEITEDSWNHIYTESNNLHISLFDEENVSLKIMNVAGQLVYEKSDLNTGNHILPMDIPTGHYLIMLSNEEKITTRKVFFR